MSMLGIYPFIDKKLAYDPIADLTPVSLGAGCDFGFAVGPVGEFTQPVAAGKCRLLAGTGSVRSKFAPRRADIARAGLQGHGVQ